MTTKPTNVAPLAGWVLVGPTQNEHGKLDGGWYVCHSSSFETKNAAEWYAKHLRWPHWPHRTRAVRGKLVADEL